MPVVEYNILGYHDYINLFSKLSHVVENRIISLFCGSLDSNGRSWCSDCRDALPVINEAIEAAKEGSKVTCHYLFVGIEREEWKHPENNFRKNPDLKLTNIPTLIVWEGGEEHKRLTEGECLDLQQVLSVLL